jgi:Zn-finger nucleic acid-binding protein
VNCPVCKSATLNPAPEAGDAPRMLECRYCGGRYLPFHEYWTWRSAMEEFPDRPIDESAIVDVPLSTPEANLAKLCPECGRIMTRTRIDLETHFFLDRCGNCGGFWFDAAKWDVLKSRHLHYEIHLINTDSWQARIKKAEIARSNEKMLRGRLGDADYEEMLRVKGWLDTNPGRDLILSFLTRARSSLPVSTP